MRRRNKGRWTKDEHERFLSVAGQLGKKNESWTWISNFVVTTRSPAQVRTHAQKYFKRIGQGLPFPDEPYTDDRVDDGEGHEENEENEGRQDDQEGGRSTAGGEAPPPQIMATPDGAGCHSPPSNGLMVLAKVPSVVSLINSYDDGGGFPQAGGTPALPPSLCSPCGLFPGFTPGQGGQDSSLDPHVAAAAAAAVTAAGAAALGHDLDGGMFFPGDSGEGSPAPPSLPPLWSGIGDASGVGCDESLSMPYDGGGGFPLDNWPSEFDL